MTSSKDLKASIVKKLVDERMVLPHCVDKAAEYILNHPNVSITSERFLGKAVMYQLSKQMK